LLPDIQGSNAGLCQSEELTTRRHGENNLITISTSIPSLRRAEVGINVIIGAIQCSVQARSIYIATEIFTCNRLENFRTVYIIFHLFALVSRLHLSI
jgi:hypothetical protein